jgi:putative FmdB family regulatory protein
MPLFEYQCKACGHRFEALVIGSRTPRCPRCEGQDLEKQFSTFGCGSSSGGFATGASRGPSCAPGGG